MAYSPVAQVKEVLGITATTFDTELTNVITDSDSFIDEYLRPYASVPVSPTPTEIGKISALLSAGRFRQRRADDQTKEHPWITEAKERLERYVSSNYRFSPAFTGTGSLEDAGTGED
ncbi:MAG: hypothetical protein HYU02_01010 [Thaumarchaeota archaeon]|nr:hypothetical protein [Nitrososphaerota archaeon]